MHGYRLFDGSHCLAKILVLLSTCPLTRSRQWVEFRIRLSKSRRSRLRRRASFVGEALVSVHKRIWKLNFGPESCPAPSSRFFPCLGPFICLTMSIPVIYLRNVQGHATALRSWDRLPGIFPNQRNQGKNKTISPWNEMKQKYANTKYLFHSSIQRTQRNWRRERKSNLVVCTFQLTIGCQPDAVLLRGCNICCLKIPGVRFGDSQVVRKRTEKRRTVLSRKDKSTPPATVNTRVCFGCLSSMERSLMDRSGIWDQR